MNKSKKIRTQARDSLTKREDIYSSHAVETRRRRGMFVNPSLLLPIYASFLHTNTLPNIFSASIALYDRAGAALLDDLRETV